MGDLKNNEIIKYSGKNVHKKKKYQMQKKYLLMTDRLKKAVLGKRHLCKRKNDHSKWEPELSPKCFKLGIKLKLHLNFEKTLRGRK